MSSKSRRHANPSHRRLVMAAGVLLAGAAIPIAAAGTAWADAVPGCTGTCLTLRDLQKEAPSLSPDQASAVVSAEENGIAAEVSDNGKIVVKANEGVGASNQAVATSVAMTGKTADTDASAAIGGGTVSAAKGNDDLAFGEGANPTGNSDRVTASGTDSTATLTDATHSTATASNDGSATIANDGNSTIVVTHDTATGTNGSVLITDSANSKATATDTGPATTKTNGGVTVLTAGATVVGSTGGTATASGTGIVNGNTVGSDALVQDATDSKATGGNGATAAIESGNGATGTLSNDTAAANGAGSAAGIGSVGAGTGNLTGDVATASSGGRAEVVNFGGSGDITSSAAKASNGATGLIENSGAAGAMSHDTATASGISASNQMNGSGVTYSSAVITDENGSGVGKDSVSNDKATATNGGLGLIANAGDSTVAVTHDTASGNNGSAGVVDAGSSSATAMNTGPATTTDVNGGTGNAYTAGATVTYATDSTAKADNTASMAAVSGTAGGYITEGHATNTIGTSTVVIDSNTTLPAAAQDLGLHSAAMIPDVVSVPSGSETVVMPVHEPMTPLTELQVMPSLPLP